MNALALVLTALVLGGCADSSTPAAAPPPPMPPPASIQVGTRAIQLAYGSFAWAGGTADYGLPSKRKDLPRIVVRRGQVVRFRLATDPDRLTLRVAGRTAPVSAVKVAPWKVTRGGLLVLRLQVGQSWATYLARVALD